MSCAFFWRSMASGTIPNIWNEPGLWHPSGMHLSFYAGSGGIAALNPRLRIFEPSWFSSATHASYLRCIWHSKMLSPKAPEL